MINLSKIQDIEFDGIDHSDYPDYCDAYISRAFLGVTGFSGGSIELSEEQLEWLNDQRDFIYEKLMEYIH